MTIAEKKNKICPVCKKKWHKVNETSLLGMKTGKVFGHPECETGMIYALRGKEKYFTGILFS